MNCKETLLDIITSIEAYPFNGQSSMHTMNMHTKRVRLDELDLNLSEKIIVPMKPKTCKLNDKDNLSAPGCSYEVTVTWQIQSLTNEGYSILESLKENHNHLIIRTYGDSSFFIRCEELGYRFSYIENEGVIDCELTIHNKNGAQRIS